MLAKAKELREQRAGLVTQARAILEKAEKENREMSEAESAEWDKLHADADALLEKAQRIERQTDVEATLVEARAQGLLGIDPDRQRAGSTGDEFRTYIPSTAELVELRARSLEVRRDGGQLPDNLIRTRQRHHLAFRGWMQSGRAGLSEEDRAVLAAYRAALPPEVRAQSTAATEGGEFVPEDFQAIITMAMAAYGGVRRAPGTQIVTTDSGADLPWPTVDDTSNTGALVAENVTATELDVVTAARILAAFLYSSKIVRVSEQLLQDSAFDMETFLRGIFSERLGRITETHYTTGDGSGKPDGLTVRATDSTIAPSAAAGVTYAQLVDILHALDPAYREGASWQMHDDVIKGAKKLVDGDSRPLWVPGIAVREPDTLLGYPYTVNNSMPTPVNTNVAIVFGLMSRYVIRDVTGMVMKRLVERYAEFHQVGFLSFLRTDGDLIDATAAVSATYGA